MSDERSECCDEKLGDFVADNDALYLQPAMSTAVSSAVGDHGDVVPTDCQEGPSGLKRRADHDPPFDVSEQFLLDPQGNPSKRPHKTTIVGFPETQEQLTSRSQSDFCNPSELCHCSTQNDLDCQVAPNSCRADDAAKACKDDVDAEEAPPDLLSNLRRVFSTSADTAEYFDPYRPRGGRPRGPKHPIWNFYKFYKSGGITMGYMCLLCSGALTGPPNTTNATKHLRSRHKNEYVMYFEIIERFKHGTFFGDLHQSIRELVLKSGAKADAMDNVDGDVNRPVLDVASPESGILMQRPWPEETAGPSQEGEIQSMLSAAFASPSLRKSFSREQSMSAENATASTSGEPVVNTPLQSQRITRKDFTLAEKIALLGLIDSLPYKTSLRQLSLVTGVPKTTISRVVQNREELENRWRDEQTQFSRKRKRDGKCPDVEAALSEWVSTISKQGGQINGPLLRRKAVELAEQLGHQDFKPTDGWLFRFKRRFGIQFRSANGVPEKQNPDVNIAEEWKATMLPQLLQTFRADIKSRETGLFLRGIQSKDERAIIDEIIALHHYLEAQGSAEDDVIETVTDECAQKSIASLRTYFLQEGNEKSPIEALEECANFVQLQSTRKSQLSSLEQVHQQSHHG